MSGQSTFSVKLTKDERDFLLRAVAFMRHESEHPTAEATLRAAKKTTVRRPAVEPEAFAPNTGDPRLDAFMRAHHTPGWKPMKLPVGRAFPRDPRAPFGFTQKRLTVTEFGEMERDWNGMCKRASEGALLLDEQLHALHLAMSRSIRVSS